MLVDTEIDPRVVGLIAQLNTAIASLHRVQDQASIEYLAHELAEIA